MKVEKLNFDYQKMTDTKKKIVFFLKFCEVEMKRGTNKCLKVPQGKFSNWIRGRWGRFFPIGTIN